jgi:hypothetical protein
LAREIATTHKEHDAVPTQHRQFVDADGMRWEVWEVQPTLIERRRVAERRRAPRGDPDRRSAWTNRPTFPLGMRHGWLAFQCAFERRRIAPFPDDWSDLDDPALRALLRQASVTSLPRRRMGWANDIGIGM